VFVKDLDGRYTLVNRRHEEVVGIGREAMLGKTDPELFSPDEWGPIATVERSVVDNGIPVSFERRMVVGGQPRVFLATRFPLRGQDGQVNGLCGISTDITERVRATEEVHAARDMLQSSIDALTPHIAILDETGVIIAVNHAWRRYADANGFRWPRYGLGRNYLAACDAAGGGHEVRQAAQGLRSIMRGEREAFQLVYPSRFGPRSTDWFQMRVTSFGSDGKLRMVVAHQDITEMKGAEESLQALTSRLLQSQDEERRRIARELHDTTAQNLFAITMNLTRLQQHLSHPDDRTHLFLRESLDLCEQSLREIRTLSYLLHPPLLDQTGLVPAIRWYVDGFSKRSGIEVNLVALEDIGRLPAEMETALFRVLQECLTNIHRHSGGHTALVRLAIEAGRLVLQVRDDGHGIDSSLVSADAADVHSLGVGIPGMRQRLRQIGGDLQIESGTWGTAVSVVVPL
jgi:PAS domain S-box-containing protein